MKRAKNADEGRKIAMVVRKKSRKRGRVAGNRRGRPRKRAKMRTGSGKSQGSSAEKAENADGWQGTTLLEMTCHVMLNEVKHL